MDDSKTFLGEFEELVLLVILKLKENAYGVTIRQLLEEIAGRPTSIGAVYTTLERLERKQFISSWQGEATATRGGRAKRYFKVEGAGMKALGITQMARKNIQKGLKKTWEPAGGTL